MIFLAADHGGFEQKEAIKKYLDEVDMGYVDKGPDHLDEKDDYPDYAYPAVAAMNPSTDKAILFCKSGEGMAILANKLPGIRAAVVWTPDVAEHARSNDDANVMAVPSMYVDIDTVKESVKKFLETAFLSEDRFTRRLNKISDVERKLHSRIPEAYNE